MLQPLAPALIIALLLLTATAAWFDFRTRRIPNWLCLAGCIAGISLNASLSSLAGLRFAGLGLGLGFALYFPLWLLGARGAGDAKLLAAAGAIVGPANTLGLFVLAALIGGVVALALILLRGATKTTLRNVGTILISLVRFQRPERTLQSPDAIRLPHAVVILLAAVSEIAILR